MKPQNKKWGQLGKDAATLPVFAAAKNWTALQFEDSAVGLIAIGSRRRILLSQPSDADKNASDAIFSMAPRGFFSLHT